MRLLWLLFVLAIPAARCWESDEMDVFDVVEEVNQNFYELMEISQDAELPEIKKAYRRLSKVLHPDKNDADDAEVKFRQLVSVYETLRDDGKRKIYDRVLVEGLPDWRSPIFYYRRARKMSMLEISIILTAVISVTQYLMAWGSYIDKRHTLEEFLVKKYKINDRKRKKNEDFENNLEQMENELNLIPRPSWWNILPIQLGKLLIFLVTGGPSMVRSILESIKLEKERRQQEKEEEEEEERRIKEEEEKRKEKRAQRTARKRVFNIPDRSNGGCVLESGDDPEDSPKLLHSRPPKSAPATVVTGGPWTEEDFTELARLMAKHPGGTPKRWHVIAEYMNRTVYEVTKMSSKVMERLAIRRSEQEENLVPEVKEKVKTKAEKLDMSAGSDEAWTTVQQKALEKALKQNPKGTDQRWEKIARLVPDKAKEDCMLRFKFLADKIKKKKLGEEEAGNEDESNRVEESEKHSVGAESKKEDKQTVKTEESLNNQIHG
ncbi:unnamed protein product, partial [Meganyctiphanes norvegica]